MSTDIVESLLSAANVSRPVSKANGDKTYLGLVGDECLQLLLVTVRQLAEVDIGGVES